MDEAVPANLQCGLPLENTVSETQPQLSPNAVDSWAPIHRRGGVPEVANTWVKENGSALQVVDVREASEHSEYATDPRCDLHSPRPPVQSGVLSKSKGTVLVCKSKAVLRCL